ncbi:MAG: acetyl-CoA C-acetyltransferase [Deltaproteobacteria bacterium]|nr:acetyl-CoA C-acetyltransferase [Deltaproteobacteria bacterium]
MESAVIAGAARTPIGSFNGALSAVPAPTLGGLVVQEALRRAGLDKGAVEEVVMGIVLAAGLGQAPARQAALGAGLPDAVHCLTMNKMCGSGLMAVALAAQAVRLGEAEVAVAGGMESMSRAPYLLEQARAGYRMGDGRLIDSMIRDGLWDVYNDFHMGAAAELLCEKHQITREEQDAYAATSYTRALEAQARGWFADEIVPVSVPQRKGPPVEVTEDEEPKRGDVHRLASLTPAFKPGGTVTAGNASSINAGAAAVTVLSERAARRPGVRPLVRILGTATASLQPEWFTIAPIEAIKRLLGKLGLRADEIDLYEINEAFAAVAIAVTRGLGLPLEKVNVHGGAVALGHPIGASGARILTTLLYAMRTRGARRGVASLCIGGGEAIAMAVEACA